MAIFSHVCPKGFEIRKYSVRMGRVGFCLSPATLHDVSTLSHPPKPHMQSVAKVTQPKKKVPQHPTLSVYEPRSHPRWPLDIPGQGDYQHLLLSWPLLGVTPGHYSVSLVLCTLALASSLAFLFPFFPSKSSPYHCQSGGASQGCCQLRSPPCVMAPVAGNKDSDI